MTKDYVIDNCQKNLDNLRDLCIGIVNIKGDTYLIIEHNSETGHTKMAKITLWAGIKVFSRTLYPSEVKLFPNGKTLLELLKTPMEFQNFVEQTQF